MDCRRTPSSLNAEGGRDRKRSNEATRKAEHDRSLLEEIAGRVLPGTGLPAVERMSSGSSTLVYRVHRADRTCYVRLAEGSEASLAPEVRVHDLLHTQGVRVPEVVYFDPFHD